MSIPVRIRFARLATAALLAAAGACGSDSAVAPRTSEPLTLPEVFDELSAAGIADAVAPFAFLTSAATAEHRTSPCTYGAATGSFVCPTVTVDGLTITQGYALLDAAGSPQSAFDASRTAAVRATSSVAGRSKASTHDVVVDARQELTLSGLLTDVHTLDGSSTVHLTGTTGAGGVTTPLDLDVSTRVDRLVLPRRPSSGDGWPRSGTVTIETTYRPGPGLPSGTASVALTFSGTSRVAVVATTGAITIRCTVDLTNATAPGCPL